QIRALEAAFAEAYHTIPATQQDQARDSEARYYSLLENAPETIVTFRPGDGRIIDANMQAQQLLGRPRLGLLGSFFDDLFPPEYQDQARWLVNQASGMTSVRLEAMAVR